MSVASSENFDILLRCIHFSHFLEPAGVGVYGGIMSGTKVAVSETLGRLGTVACTAAFLGACASEPKFPPAPPQAASPDYNYVIGPGDNVNIIVWRNPELSMSVPVRPDGKITTALIEDLPAMGRDSTTLAREMEKALSKYIRDPVVTVIVTGFIGPYSEQIRVVGEAANRRRSRTSRR